MKEKFTKYFDYFAFFYFLVGVICSAIVKYTSVTTSDLGILGYFYIYTCLWSTLVYFTFGCLLYKHRNYLMNIIDGIMCFCLTVFYPFDFFNTIYTFNKYLYYFLGCCFSFLPLIFCIIDKKKIEFQHIFRTITRLLIILFVILVMFLLKSCGAPVDIAG